VESGWFFPNQKARGLAMSPLFLYILNSYLPHHHAKVALGSGAHILYLIVILFVLGSFQESVEIVFGLVALL
jgi:hypothetical protein